MADPRGAFLYEIVMKNLAAQAADQQALTGRAKDLIGYTAISSTITGAIANDRVFASDATALPETFAVLLAIGVSLTLAAGLYALRPRTWSFATNAGEMFSYVSDNLDEEVDGYYAAAARGFTNRPAPQMMSPLENNARQLRNLQRALYVQLVGVVLLALSGLALALVVVA